MTNVGPPIAVAHLDESCLGNGREGANPGGSGALIEIRHQGSILRRDVFIHAPATTNNRMALSGAIAVLQLLSQKEKRLRLLLISDSEYLVKGVREWAPGWMARGWTRKGGPIENLELWQALMKSVPLHDAQWTWVRGHSGHPKNEYVNDLAVGAATRQETSAGIVESGFQGWLAKERARKGYVDNDPDAAFTALEARLATDDRFKVAE